MYSLFEEQVLVIGISLSVFLERLVRDENIISPIERESVFLYTEES